MIEKTSTSSSASGMLGLMVSLGLLITPSSGSAAPLLLAPQRTADQRVCVQVNTASTATDEHAASKLFECAKRLGPKNSARARRIAELAPALASILGAVEDAQSAIECTWCDDGSLLAEWMLRDRRIGFSFETDEALSSWFIASRPRSQLDGSGYLRDIDPLVVIVRGLLPR